MSDRVQAFGVHVGQALRRARRGRERSQDGVAAAMREQGFHTWTRQCVLNVEKGRRALTVDEFRHVCFVLAVSPQSIWNRANDTKRAAELDDMDLPSNPAEWLASLGDRL